MVYLASNATRLTRYKKEDLEYIFLPDGSFIYLMLSLGRLSQRRTLARTTFL